MTLEHNSQHETWFTGRNGTFVMKGWEIFNSSIGAAFISPITSRRKIGRCQIEVAAEDLDLFIDHLSQIRDAVKQKQHGTNI
jgi:hypothetical protein